MGPSSFLSTATITIAITITMIMFQGEEVIAVRGTRVDYSRKCEGVKIDLCRGVGYNMTGMPNFVGHELQQDAELQLQTFAPLIQYGCSSQLKFFLCSVYVPMCNEKVPENIGPCKPLCESVRDRCQPVLLEFGFPWPTTLDCDKFPAENNHRHMCMEGPGESDLDPVPSSSMKPMVRRPIVTKPPIVPRVPGKGLKPSVVQPPVIVYSEEGEVMRPSVKRVSGDRMKNGLCSRYKYSSEYVYINRTSSCGHKCSADILFSKENKAFSQIWLFIWSLISCVLTAFTMITFILDSSQYRFDSSHFRYPERVIVILASTFFMYSLGSMIRIAFGRDAVACHTESQHGMNLLIQEGPDNFKCTIVFVILYYFWMTSMVWWVNLTIMWFLATGLNWSPEAIERKCSYFHIIAWTLPALQTLAILILRVVDADELTGTCFVGNHNTGTLLVFLILPSTIYIAIGLTFLLARWYYLFVSRNQEEGTSLRIRHPSHHSSCSSHNSNSVSGQFAATFSVDGLSNCCNPRGSKELLHLRISFFTYFYLLPSICLLATNVYEYKYRDSWYQSFQGHHGNVSRPNVEVFTLKIFFQLITGILSGLWIWSSKSPVAMWRRTLCRIGKPSSVGTAASFGTINKQPIPPVSAYFMTLPPSVPTTAPSSFPGSLTLPPSPFPGSLIFPPCPVPSAASSTLSRHLVAAHNKAQQQQTMFVSTMDKRNGRMLYGSSKGGETTV